VLVIDIALLVGGALVVVAIAAVVGGKVGPRAEARRRRLQGARNAQLMQRSLEERCVVCDAAIDPENDVFDAGQWWHRGCYREALR
jgi:hypothetical protein